MLVYYNLLLDGTWVSTKEISFHQVHVKNEEEEYKMITCFEKQEKKFIYGWSKE